MDDPIAHPTHLAALARVQPGSVVSRVLFRSDAGVMTLFAFGEGQGLSEHSTPHDATVLVLEGQVRITIADAEHRVEEGQILRLPADVPHSLQSDGAFKMLLTLFKRRPGD